MISSLCDSLLQLLLLAPFLVAACLHNKGLGARPLILGLLVFIATSLATSALAAIRIVEGQEWNWVGKIAAAIIALAFIYSYRALSPAQFGLTAKVELEKTRSLFMICAAYFLMRLLLYLALAKGDRSFHPETALYQATWPGIAEELVFRGVLLSLLNQVFLKPKWAFANVSFGWAAIITSLLFGFTHGMYVDDHYGIHFSVFAILRTAFDGFLLALLRERTKSLVPGILVHNLLNLIGNH